MALPAESVRFTTSSTISLYYKKFLNGKVIRGGLLSHEQQLRWLANNMQLKKHTYIVHSCENLTINLY